ncbi:hypothetical protein [Reyranella sp. CPCC 100927]|uniref:hypothetical protein n=1 Tax=Reyranella sp. CPCC 100927 TaxID=2599616 RepID=UPI001C499CDD|nr:hypothetical protein [Reyranella sp. CPCC 100927]
MLQDRQMGREKGDSPNFLNVLRTKPQLSSRSVHASVANIAARAAPHKRGAGRSLRPKPAPVFGKRSQFQSGMSFRSVLLIILAIVLVAGFVVLAFIDVAPPQRTREIPILPPPSAK